MKPLKFNRSELSGAFGDIGTLLPIALSMIAINGLDAKGLFLSVGLCYLFTGWYFKVPISVQPMKVIGAYAIAMGLSSSVIFASSLLFSGILLIIGIFGLIHPIGRYTPKSVIKGVQFCTGTLLIAKGTEFIVGTSPIQEKLASPEPYMSLTFLKGVPVSLLLGIAAIMLILFFLKSKRMPAGLIVILFGGIMGVLIGAHGGKEYFNLSFYLPEVSAISLPEWADCSYAFMLLVLPQLPMTVGNAVISSGDLARSYYGDAARRVSLKGLTLSMAGANLLSFFLGGMPMCHGAGGIAAHYRFGARTGGATIMMGGIFIAMTLLFGDGILNFLRLIPFSVLGAMLLFSGVQLSLTVLDLKGKNEFLIPIVMVGITLGVNLAVAFIVGILIAVLSKRRIFSSL